MTATTATTCPSWCEAKNCHGDHWALCQDWPSMRVHIFPTDEIVSASVKPTWCEMDGEAPQVAVHFDGTVDLEFFLTPKRARELGQHLLAVADAVGHG